jgi:hypothetical protein
VKGRAIKFEIPRQGAPTTVPVNQFDEFALGLDVEDRSHEGEELVAIDSV